MDHRDQIPADVGPPRFDGAASADDPVVSPLRWHLRRPTRVSGTRGRTARYVAVGLAAGLLVGALPAGGAQQHLVVTGETLSAIAARYGVALSELAARNDLADPDFIVAGQVLLLPDDAGGPASIHTVVAGETVAQIAASYGVGVDELVAANSLANPNLIVIGTTLTVPGPASNGDGGAATSVDHTVAPGDTLAVIAARYGITVADLASANGIDNPDVIVIGSVLEITPGGASTPAAPQEPAESAPPTRTHAVTEGETLAVIAARYGVTVAELVDANGIADSNVVISGTSLVIPDPPQAVEPEVTSPTAERDTPVGTDVAPRLEYWANEYGVPVDLFKALTWFESGWNNDVVSEVGAVGIGQLMPATVDFVSRWLIGEPIDPTVPDQNIRASARFLRYLLDQTENRPSQAIAAYYQGLTALRQHGIYDSSRFYVDGILALRSTFAS